MCLDEGEHQRFWPFHAKFIPPEMKQSEYIQLCKTFYTLLDKEGTDRTIFTAMNAVLNLLLEEGERVKCSPFT